MITDTADTRIAHGKYSADSNDDILIGEMLELSGAFEIAQAAWLCRVDADGALIRTLAQAGPVSQSEVARVLASLSGLINLTHAAQPFQWLSGGREYVICAIGDPASERLILFLRTKASSAGNWPFVQQAAARIQRLVYLGLSIGGPAQAPAPAQAIPEVPVRDLVDLCPFGIMVVDLDQAILLANAAMSAFFANSSIIGNFHDRFEILNSDDAVRFHVALRTVLSAPLGKDVQQTMALGDGDSRPILLSVSRLAGDIGAPRACVIVTDTGADHKVHIQPLAQLFALTPVETRLVTELMHGHSLQEAALSLKLKVETVRTYLKQIFLKTGTHRQLDLVELMKGGALPSLA